MRDKMGLSKEQAEKIIKGVQNQRLIGGLEAAKNTGSLSLQKVLDMKEAGVEIDSFISEEMRLNLYTKEVNSQAYIMSVYKCVCVCVSFTCCRMGLLSKRALTVVKNAVIPTSHPMCNLWP